MKLITLWTTKAKDLVRDIAVIDIDNDDEPEVLFSSWDERVYCINGLSGNKKWVSKYPSEFGGPAERISPINLDGKGKFFVAASFHKNIMIFSGEDGTYETHHTVDGWINVLKTEDIDKDGFDELIVLTRRGSLYVIDDDFSILFKNKDFGPQTPYSLNLCDFNYDGQIEILVGSKEFTIFDPTGDILLRKKLPDYIMSVTSGKVLEDRPNWVIAGFKGGLMLIDENHEILVHKLEGLYPFITDVADINGDGVNEIIVADWGSDSIVSYKATSKGGLRKLSSIKVGANVLSMAHGDIDGDGADELVFISEQINENLYVVKGNKVFRMDSYPALLGLAVDDAIGYNGKEIIARTGRESISLMLAVPRINVEEPITEGHEFSMSVATLGSGKLSTGSVIEIKSKEKYYRTKIPKQGYLILAKHLALPKKAGTTVVSVKQDSKTVIKKVINIATDGVLESSIDRVFVFDEDITKVRGINDIESKINALKLNIRNDLLYLASSIRGWIPVKVRVKSTSKQSRKLHKVINLFIANPIKVTITRSKILRSTGYLEATVENLSRRQLVVWFEGGKNISIRSDRKVLEPRSSSTFLIQYKVNISEFSKEMNLSVLAKYKGEIEHIIPLGIRAKVINDDKVLELLEELKELKTSKEGKLKVLSEKISLPESLIEELYSDLLE